MPVGDARSSPLVTLSKECELSRFNNRLLAIVLAVEEEYIFCELRCRAKSRRDPYRSWSLRSTVANLISNVLSLGHSRLETIFWV